MFKDKESLNEKQLIQEFFSDVGSAFLVDRGIILGVGDDSAVVEPANQEFSILSSDTSISDIHFFNDMNASDIAYRSVAISLSDILACGAEPSWFMLSITLDSPSREWLSDFKLGLKDISSEFKIPLIGGDVTKGSLSITVQAGGYSRNRRIISRSGAQEEDLIFVTGKIGESYASLQQYSKGERGSSCIAYTRPQLRTGVALKLNGLVNSAIDISDGLFQDLQEICTMSNKGAKVNLEKVPHPFGKSFDYSLLNKGDDYEICFTSPIDNRKEILEISKEEGVKITEIGKINNSNELKLFNKRKEVVIDLEGYQHF